MTLSELFTMEFTTEDMDFVVSEGLVYKIVNYSACVTEEGYNINLQLKVKKNEEEYVKC